MNINATSLFSNVGVAETYLSELGINVVVANELIEERAIFYKHLYPHTNMVCGDITSDKVRDSIVKLSIEQKVDFIIATPPCQGMSRHGKREEMDPRNFLIYYALDVIKRVRPKYILLENVPKLLTTKICISNEIMLIPDYIKKELGDDYIIPDDNVFDSSYYGVPQSRKRCIYRLVRRDITCVWPYPKPHKKITMFDAIGNLPSLDPLVREEDKRYIFPDYEKKKLEGLKVSKWHYPPTHSWKHIEWMMHTPSGKTAFYNEHYFPQKDDGTMINGRLSCYRRYSWDKPANTVTQNNGVISSAACVHPGRPIVESSNDIERLYSDPRVLSIYELLIISSLPKNWNIPEWASEKLIRNVIGEGIPPKLVYYIVKELVDSL